jgi:hypothetical protein
MNVHTLRTMLQFTLFINSLLSFGKVNFFMLVVLLKPEFIPALHMGLS